VTTCATKGAFLWSAHPCRLAPPNSLTRACICCHRALTALIGHSINFFVCGQRHAELHARPWQQHDVTRAQCLHAIATFKPNFVFDPCSWCKGWLCKSPSPLTGSNAYSLLPLFPWHAQTRCAALVSFGTAFCKNALQESPRVEFQLRGRAGRQGDPGASVFLYDVTDPLLSMYNQAGAPMVQG